MISRPPPLRTDVTQAWVHYSMKERVPAIIDETIARNPDYSPEIHAKLADLRDAIAGDQPIRMPPDSGMPDLILWAKDWLRHRGETWLNTEWFFAETFAYRHIIEIVEWYKTHRDPFLPKKEEELASSALRERLELALAGHTLPPEERLRESLHHALWGNRIDLSYALAMAHGTAVQDDDLLVDDSVAVLQHLAQRPGDIHIIHDNYGTEYACDLALIDTFLATTDRRIFQHFKAHPTFVSDVTLADDLHFRQQLWLDRYGLDGRALAERLDHGAARITRKADWYWNCSAFAWDLPDRLQGAFEGAALIIFKGDLNYRRIIGDARWPTVTPFSEVVSYFPAPVLALRTLKSDTICGLAEGLAGELEGIDPQWRVNGKRGLIQFKP